MANKTLGNSRLVMCIKPQTKVRFRYESEGGSHGGLTGKGEGKEKVHPTVQLVGYNGKKTIYVKVSLYTEDHEQHILELKGPNGSVQFLEEKLKDDNTATFANIKILNKKQEEIYRLLMDKKLKQMGSNINKVARTEIERKHSKEIKDKAKDILNSVRLCFEAFEEGKQHRLCDRLFSEVISNQKTASKGELRIHRMSKFAGNWKGGDEVILLCDRVQKDNIKVEFYEINEDDCIIWNEPAKFNTADVHYQVAITFRTPPYRQNTGNEVLVRLARGTDYSEPRIFTYTPDFDDKPLKKRKLFDCEESINASPPEQMMDNKCSLELSSNYNGSADSFETFQDVLPGDMDIVDAVHYLGLHISELEGMNQDYVSPFEEDFAPINEVYQIIQTQGLDCVDSQLQMDVGRASKSLDAMNIDGGEPANKCKAEKLLQEGRCKKLKIKNNINSLLGKRDDSGNTFLHISVFEDKDITILLKANELADGNIINEQNFNLETVLHVATKLNKVEVVKRLLLHKANPNLKNEEGNNCYHIASENDLVNIMFCLLSCAKGSPQLDAFNYAGLSPLHLAIKNKSDGCYNLLKTHSANLSSKEQIRGRSLLHYAVEFWPNFLTTLLSDEETSKLVNIQDYEGNTPLHLSAAYENMEVVKQLLQAGADPFLKNFKPHSNSEENTEDIGQIAADLTDHPEILEVFQKSSSHISASDDLIEELCKLLDVNERWKCLALYFVEEKFINSLQCDLSPTKALLNHIKKEYKETFIEKLKNVVEMAGLEDALIIFKEKNF